MRYICKRPCLLSHHGGLGHVLAHYFPGVKRSSVCVMLCNSASCLIHGKCDIFVKGHASSPIMGGWGMCLRIISQESSRRTHRALALFCLCISERVRPLAFLCLNQKCEILKVRSPTAIMGAGRSDLTHFRFRQRNARGLTPDKGPEEDRRREDASWSRSALPPLGAGGRERAQT